MLHRKLVWLTLATHAAAFLTNTPPSLPQKSRCQPWRAPAMSALSAISTHEWAPAMAKQALSGLQLEYPHKVDHLWLESDGPLVSPSSIHPVFYGNYDWHSAVHSHWCLVRLLRRFPGEIEADVVATALQRSITKEGCLREAEYFAREGAATFERPYGWGWLLKLQEECMVAHRESLDPHSACARYEGTFEKLCGNLDPVTRAVRDGWLAYLPKLSFPVRSGVHSNTAFGLTLSYTFAQSVGDEQLRDAIRNAALRLYGGDRGYSPAFEPSGEDFLSPGLCEIELMRHVIREPRDFRVFVECFMPELMEHAAQLGVTVRASGVGEDGRGGIDKDDGVGEEEGIARRSILRLPTVSDRSDARICHLDGLLLSKAWQLRTISSRLSESGVGPEVVDALRTSADEHYGAASWRAADYVGSHWLHSFALLALDPE